MEHDYAERTDVETKDWIFLVKEAAFEQLRWWLVDISIDTLK